MGKDQNAKGGLVCAHPPLALSGAGSLESRPRNQEKEVKTGKRAMTVESGRPPLGAISERRA